MWKIVERNVHGCQAGWWTIMVDTSCQLEKFRSLSDSAGGQVPHFVHTLTLCKKRQGDDKSATPTQGPIACLQYKGKRLILMLFLLLLLPSSSAMNCCPPLHHSALEPDDYGLKLLPTVSKVNLSFLNSEY